MAGRLVLGVLDRAYRGAVEAQFFDALYGFLDLREQIGEVHLALRGPAVTMAVDEHAYRPVLRLGAVVVDTMPDYRGTVRELLRDGITVFVDEPDLRSLGFVPDQVVAGACCIDTNGLAERWGDYDEVWFV